MGGPAPASTRTSPAEPLIPLSIPDYALDLQITLQALDNNPGNAGHTLTIPTLGFVVGAFAADRYAQNIKDNQSFIIGQLAEKLGKASYDQLLASGASSDYLNNFILDAMGSITQTDRFKEYPAPSGGAPLHYGVVGVSMPASFSVK